MAARQFSGKQEFYPSRTGGTLGGDRKAATALVFQDVVGGVASTVAIQGDDGTLIAIQATALNTDQIIFNTVIVYVNALGGGLIYVEQGNYTLSATVNLLDSTGLSGSGENTDITGAGNFHLITINAQDDCFVEHLQLSGTSTGNNVDCIYGVEAVRPRIEDVIVTNSDRHGIYFSTTGFLYGGWILNCSVTNTDVNGIMLDGLGGGAIRSFVVSENYVFSVLGDGIHLQDSDQITCSDNVVYAASLNGIYSDNCIESTLSGNVVSHCVQHGIFNESGQRETITGNTCCYNDSGNTASYDGINVEAGSDGTTVSDNICFGNHRYGIAFGDAANAGAYRAKIEGNMCQFNDWEGIYIRGVENQILDNYVYDNGQDAAGTYHGILLHGDSDRCDISGNYINSPGDSQEDCIHLADGASNVKILGNYCYNGMGDGIELIANNDDCFIHGNYLLNNDDYGIAITAATCNDNDVRDNYYSGNTAGAINNLGTDTKTQFINVLAPNQDSYVGATVSNHRGQQCLDNVTTQVPFEIPIPNEFQELVTAHVIYVTEASGIINRSVATDFGKVCAGEQIDAHSGAIAAGDIAGNTVDEFECDEISAALAGIAAGDRIGLTWTNFGAAAGTIDATVWVIEIRIRYV